MRPRATLPPVWRELPHLPGCVAWMLKAAARGRRADAPDVLLIPGLFSGDHALGALAKALEQAGHAPTFAGLRMNVDCSEATLARLARHVEDAVVAAGAPVTLVGHSRGGLLGRVLAVRRPDLVTGLVTLGSPHLDQLAVHPVLWAGALALATAAGLGVRGVLRYGCAGGGCCAPFAADLTAPLPPHVGFVSLYSRTDGLVDWRACLDPAARHVEVPVPHLAMTTAPAALAAVQDALHHLAPAISP